MSPGPQPVNSIGSTRESQQPITRVFGRWAVRKLS